MALATALMNSYMTGTKIYLVLIKILHRLLSSAMVGRLTMEALVGTRITQNSIGL